MKRILIFFAIISSTVLRFQQLPLRWKEVINLADIIVSVVSGILFVLYAFAAIIVYFIWKRFYPIIGFSYFRCMHLTGVVPSFLNTVKA